jgi:hypothetical protein
MGIAALEAKLAGDTPLMQRKVQAMEQSSQSVIDNLQRMSDSALADPSLLCNE